MGADYTSIKQQNPKESHKNEFDNIAHFYRETLLHRLVILQELAREESPFMGEDINEINEIK